jgi:alpha-beta hydrolase superfamily lysophospholipase
LRTTVRWPVTSNGQPAPGKLPLFVFAHGYSVSAATYSSLLDGIARLGVVVAAPDFPGESTAYPGRATESDLPSEPCDIEFVATALERKPPAPLQRVLPGAPLVVGGHSDGGTAAAAAGYASTCSDTPIRGVVALSPNDVKMTAAYRFGAPPPLLAMTGSADEINPTFNTRALYSHVPGRAWLITVDGGRHLATFTTDPDLARIEAAITDFVIFAAAHDTDAQGRLGRAGTGRLHLARRSS